jgi:hypothetical protein
LGARVLTAGRRLLGVHPSPAVGLLLAFGFGCLIRSIPELLAYPHPIGFDTIYYGWRISEGVVWTHWSSMFSSWLLYGLLVPVHQAVTVEPFLLLKVTMPLLFGVNVGGVYYLATRGLGWSVRKGLFTAGLFSFQMGILGISWHFYRNMLGLGIALFAVPWILRDRLDWPGLAVFGGLSVLAVFSHEYAAVLLLGSVAAVAAARWSAGRKRDAVKVLGAAAPAIAVFVGSLVLQACPVYRAAEPNVLRAYQAQGYYSGPLFFMVNYLGIADTVQSYPTYLHLAASVGSLFLLLYAALLPLALIGFFRNRVVDAWTVLLSVGAFGCLAVPFFAVNYWSRWMLMLVVPVTFYAANGFVKVLRSARPVAASVRRVGGLRVSWRAAQGLVLVSVTCGLVFMTSPMFFDQFGVYALPTTVNYVPSTMLSNAVPLCDVEGVVAAFRWVDAAMDDASSCLAHDALFYWARYSLDGAHTVVFFKGDVWAAVRVAAAQGFTRCWLVWWNTDIGWYGFRVPAEFVEVYRADRISVYAFGG